MSYTKIEYTNPIESIPAPEDILGQQVETMTFASKLIVWGCDGCGSLVWDQKQHDFWHSEDGKKRK